MFIQKQETAVMINFIKQKYINLVSDTRFSEILTGSAWALLARVLATISGFIFSVLVARFYGAEIVGIVAVVNSFLMLATIFTVLGTETSILRIIPEHLTNYSPTSAFKVYRKTQYMVIGISLITGAVFFLGADFIAAEIFSKPHLSFYFSMASVFIVFQAMMRLNTQAVRGLRLIKTFALMMALPQSFNLIFLIFMSLFISDPNIPIYAALAGFTMTGILGWIIMENVFKKMMQPNDDVCNVSGRTIFSISLPMLMSAAMMFFIAQTGVLILGMFRPEAEVGRYSIAVKLATLTAFVLQAVNSMAGPKFSGLYYSGKMDELFYVAKKSAKLIFYTTIPILIGFLIFGKLILCIVFGADFVVAYPALVVLVVGQFVNSISGSSGIFMNMTNNQQAFRNIMAVAAITNISLNILLTPQMGMVGTAVSAMVSLCFWNLATLMYIKVKFGKTTGYFPFI